jgi:hypothetical protein
LLLAAVQVLQLYSIQQMVVLAVRGVCLLDMLALLLGLLIL